MNADIYQARIYLAQVRVFASRGHLGFAHTLLQWAACARLRCVADRIIDRWSVQPDLFGESQ